MARNVTDRLHHCRSEGLLTMSAIGQKRTLTKRQLRYTKG
jgi:hypothetical protein